MQSFSASLPDHRPRLLVVELWGVGDIAMAIPFIRAAAAKCRVTLLAKPHAEPLVKRFCPDVELIPFSAPWTSHRGKYRLHRWSWLELSALLGGLRHRRFDAAVSVRPDPRDHLLIALSGAGIRAGYPRCGSRALLNEALARPASPHRFACWQTIAATFGWKLPAPAPAARRGRNIVIHTGAAQPTRQWGQALFADLATRLRRDEWTVTVLDERSGDLDQLLVTLSAADRFIGNDSGPGHLAAILGVPTFTVIGSYPPELFHPLHPQAAWIEGAPCPHKPCNDYCRFAEPHCIRSITMDETWSRITSWLRSIDQPSSTAR